MTACLEGIILVGLVFFHPGGILAAAAGAGGSSSSARHGPAFVPGCGGGGKERCRRSHNTRWLPALVRRSGIVCGLFDMPFGGMSSARKPTRPKIPSDVRRELASAAATVPYTVALDKETLVVRHLETTDLATVVRICVREFGSYTPSSPLDLLDTTPSNKDQGDLLKVPPNIQQRIDDAFTWYENFCFAWIVQLGLDQRIRRRKQGDDPSRPEIPPDHNVLCLATLREDGTEDEVVGIAEVSVQPLLPTRTAPPIVLPSALKRVLCNTDPIAYVSNVVVDESRRGRGYGTILMCAAEGRAKSMGFGRLYLHVDANLSGKTAQSLYWGLGYEAFVENEQQESSPFAWMGQDLVSTGLFLVDGVPLLFLQKDLN